MRFVAIAHPSGITGAEEAKKQPGGRRQSRRERCGHARGVGHRVGRSCEGRGGRTKFIPDRTMILGLEVDQLLCMCAVQCYL